MGVDPGRIALEFFDGSHAKEAARRRLSSSAHHTSNPGRYRRGPDGREVIELDLTHAAGPALLAATIAHELAHARLIGERRYAADEPKNEELTDLATVYLGMGILRANAAVSFTPGVQGWSARPLGALTEQALLGQGDFDYQTLGYLDEPQFGYALACLCGLRRELAPPWAAHLDPGVRVMLDRSLGYFRKKASRS